MNALAADWLPMANEAEIPVGKASLVRRQRQELLIFHTESGWTCYDNTCPHAGAPIFADHFDGETVTCMYHGLRFRASDGGCADCPGWDLEPYPVKVEEGKVWIGFPPAPTG